MGDKVKVFLAADVLFQRCALLLAIEVLTLKLDHHLPAHQFLHEAALSQLRAHYFQLLRVLLFSGYGAETFGEADRALRDAACRLIMEMP